MDAKLEILVQIVETNQDVQLLFTKVGRKDVARIPLKIFPKLKNVLGYHMSFGY